MSEPVLIVGYELGVVILLAGLVQRVGRKRDLAKEFEGLHFLKWSFGLSAVMQIGFTLMVSFIYHDRQSVAVVLTTLIAIPGWLVVAGWLQWSFFRRYNRLPNLLKRLEQLSPADRAALLESLPPEVFRQLPGDYRFVNIYQEPGSRH